MNEKRFTFGAVSPNVAMIKDNGEPMDIGEVVDRLNKQQITIQSLQEENEQLREEYAESLADEVKKNGLLNEEINQLRIENMRLKKRW